jgi:uncharacterized protein YraI
VNQKNFILLIAATILCSSCVSQNPVTVVPVFVTATLMMPTPLPPVTQPATLAESAPTPEATVIPIDGTTTSQINVRKAPSTASESAGMIELFTKVQVVGQDPSGSWYQIIYANSPTGKGWVRAEYVQVNAGAEIPHIEAGAGSGSAVSGLITQKVNIRNGPGVNYQSIGTLNPNDVVSITGKDPNSKWMQIEFASVPDSKGWVSTEFLKTGNTDSVPVIAVATDSTPAPQANTESPSTSPGTTNAMQDNDSMQAPLTSVTLSPSGSYALQLNGEISTPGDTEDWVQFTTDRKAVAIKSTCSSDTLQIELWSDGKPVDGFSSSCGKTSFATVTPNSNYLLRMTGNKPGYISYILNVEAVR